MTWWQLFACWLLEWAERFYLHAHGWERKSEIVGEYLPPDDYAFRRHHSYVRSHAVNAQKQLTYNPMHGGPRRDPDLPLRSTSDGLYLFGEASSAVISENKFKKRDFPVYGAPNYRSRSQRR